MIASVFLFSLLACGVLCVPNYEEKVIGGSEAKLGEIPYIVYIRCYLNSTTNGECGGSILDKNHILTAAHCLFDDDGIQYNPNNIIIKYGVIDKESPDNNMRVKNTNIHEDYNDDNIEIINDIAVLTLDGEIEFGPNVAATVLPSSNLNIGKENISATISGWGDSKKGDERLLLTAELPIFNDETCEILSEGYNSKYHICTGTLDGSYRDCYGDSGGPVYADGVQQGIVSYGTSKNDDDSCDIPHNPGVSTRVANYLDWIKKAMAED